MRVAAILGPAAREHNLVRFAAPGIELHVVPELACGERYDAVLVFGGDGTVHRQLGVLHQSKMPLLVIPVGSGNDLARELGLHTIRRAWRAWRRFCAGAGNVREIDLGVIRPVADFETGTAGGDVGATFFTCIAGTGMDSAANRRANLMRPWWRAHGGYIFAALREIATWKPVRIRVSALKSSNTGVTEDAEATGDTEGTLRLDESATFVVFANGSCYGDGMRMAPRASIDDGLIDVCYVRRTTKRRLLKFFPTVYAGAHLKLPEVEYLQAERVCVHAEPATDIYADGEYVCRTPVEIGVIRRGLRVIV